MMPIDSRDRWLKTPRYTAIQVMLSLLSEKPARTLHWFRRCWETQSMAATSKLNSQAELRLPAIVAVAATLQSRQQSQ